MYISVAKDPTIIFDKILSEIETKEEDISKTPHFFIAIVSSLSFAQIFVCMETKSSKGFDIEFHRFW